MRPPLGPRSGLVAPVMGSPLTGRASLRTHLPFVSTRGVATKERAIRNQTGFGRWDVASVVKTNSNPLVTVETATRVLLGNSQPTGRAVVYATNCRLDPGASGYAEMYLANSITPNTVICGLAEPELAPDVFWAAMAGVFVGHSVESAQIPRRISGSGLPVNVSGAQTWQTSTVATRTLGFVVDRSVSEMRIYVNDVLSLTVTGLPDVALTPFAAVAENSTLSNAIHLNCAFEPIRYTALIGSIPILRPGAAA